MSAYLIVSPASSLRVVALTLLDRLVVVAHRAGCTAITIVAQGPLPELRRARALSIPFEVVPALPPDTGDALVAQAEVLVTVADLRRLLAHGGQLADTAGQVLPVAVRKPGQPDGGLLRAEGVAARVSDAAAARAAGEALWASLTSSSDGTVDRYFNRPVGRRLFSRWLVHTPITPNQISTFATLLGVVAGALFGTGDRPTVILAAVLFQISAIIDCVDGDVARSVFKESPLGKWLDIVGDQVVHAAVFAGIAVGLVRSGAPGPHIWLGASAVVGGLIAFAVVLRGLQGSGGTDTRLQRLLDSATNRDFSVLVLALAVVDRLGIFLWLAGIGSHVFWIALLALQLAARRGPGRNA